MNSGGVYTSYFFNHYGVGVGFHYPRWSDIGGSIIWRKFSARIIEVQQNTFVVSIDKKLPTRLTHVVLCTRAFVLYAVPQNTIIVTRPFDSDATHMLNTRLSFAFGLAYIFFCHDCTAALARNYCTFENVYKRYNVVFDTCACSTE